MPGARKVGRRRYGAKKPRYAQKKRGRKTVNVNRALTPFAQRYITSMKYSELVGLNLANGYNYQMNLNSIFDPNRTGVGHQPYGHDTMQTLYNRYRVIAAYWTVSVFNASNTVVAGAMPANEVLTFTTSDEIIENPRTRWVIQSLGGGVKTLKGKVSIASLVGRTKTQYMSDDRYQAQFGSSPAELAILNVAANTLAGTDVNVDMQITITYVVECFDVKHLSQS